ncbi:rrna-processing protein fcf2 [Coemansia sp. RSA 552]|nr:rrna-processing protein fcf2 [Coemansia sp. RSA 552]
MAASKGPRNASHESDDTELDQLLQQARQDLQRKQDSEAERQSKAKGAAQGLSVPMRLHTGDMSRGTHPLKLDEVTGMAQLDTSKIHDADSGTAARKSTVSGELEAKMMQTDPTVKRKSPKEAAKEREQTAGKSWFGMKAPVMTDELKNDLRVLQLRNVLDPKRFYKKSAMTKEVPKYFEVGTIVEGPTEFYSSRMTRKQRRSNLVDELLADKKARDYFKSKVSEIHAHNASGGRHWYKTKHGDKFKGKKPARPRK